MIYLVDDTELSTFGADFILEPPYSRVVTRISSEEQYQQYRDELASANCVLVHRTFCNSNRIVDELSELTGDGDKCPIIIFSAGDSAVADYRSKEMPNYIAGIEKGVFYSRIKDFCDHYIATKQIDVALIAYGAKKSYQELRPLCLHIIKGFELCKHEEIMTILDSGEFKTVIQNAFSDNNINVQTIISDVISGKMTIDNVVFNLISVLNSFEKYGKNIYPWK